MSSSVAKETALEDELDDGSMALDAEHMTDRFAKQRGEEIDEETKENGLVLTREQMEANVLEARLQLKRKRQEEVASSGEDEDDNKGSSKSDSDGASSKVASDSDEEKGDLSDDEEAPLPNPRSGRPILWRVSLRATTHSRDIFSRISTWCGRLLLLMA